MNKLATNRQIMQWLSLGCGEWNFIYAFGIGNQWSYNKGEEDEPVSEDLRVRQFGSNDWVIPYEGTILSDINKKTMDSIF